MERVCAKSALLVRVPGALCALPLSEVVETMRPLPVKALAGVPEFVRGVALIRGVPVPVVEVAAFFAQSGNSPTGRFVTVRVDSRTVALSVEQVVGIVDLSGAQFATLPPLLGGVRSDVVETIGSLDSDLLVLLRTARMVPDAVWDEINRSKAAARGNDL